MKNVKEFFDTHPGTDEVHEALGYLFTEKPDAEAMLAGVAGEKVTTYNRADFDAPAITDQDTGEDDKEKRQVPDPKPEPIPIVHNEATTYGKTAEEIAEMEKAKKIQKPIKESADKAKSAQKAKGKPSGK